MIKYKVNLCTDSLKFALLSISLIKRVTFEVVPLHLLLRSVRRFKMLVLDDIAVTVNKHQRDSRIERR